MGVFYFIGKERINEDSAIIGNYGTYQRDVYRGEPFFIGGYGARHEVGGGK